MLVRLVSLVGCVSAGGISRDVAFSPNLDRKCRFGRAEQTTTGAFADATSYAKLFYGTPHACVNDQSPRRTCCRCAGCVAQTTTGALLTIAPVLTVATGCHKPCA
jgi:hypothetical protein